MTATAAGVSVPPALMRMVSVGSGMGDSRSARRDSSYVRSPSRNSARTRVLVALSSSTSSRSMSWS